MAEYIYSVDPIGEGEYSHTLVGELVRCKDCAHYQNEHLCRRFSRYGTIETKPMDYCSYGERRDDEID